MCDHFANGKAHGNLCRHFCVTGSITPQSCQTFHLGKEVVFSANYENQPVSIYIDFLLSKFCLLTFLNFLSLGIR